MASGNHLFLFLFLLLNVLFLVGTAIWFRVYHASSSNRFQSMLQETLIDEVMWQYSLRSNLLLFGCVLCGYLIYIEELEFLLFVFVLFSIVNLMTDSIYIYESAPTFNKVRDGHRIAAAIIFVVGFYYLIYV